MRLYILFLASFITFSASALQIGDFFQNAEVIKANAVASANESIIKVQTTIKGYQANSPYSIKTVPVPKTSFMSHIKANLKSLPKRNVWYAGWFATVGAAGWAIDELHNQMTTSPPNQSKERVYCFKAKTASEYTCSFDPAVAGLGKCQVSSVNYTCGDVTDVFSNSSPAYSFTVRINTNSGNLGFIVNPTTCSSNLSPDILSACNGNIPSVAVTDDALYQSLISEMLKDPKAAAQAFMVPDAWPYPYPHIFPDPVKYVPGVSETDEALLDALIKGQLQTTNPGAANYVTPEKLQQLQTLLSQLQQGITPEGQAGAANDRLKDPITQAQLEETLKKEKEAEAKADQEAATSAQAALAPAEATLDKLNEEKQWFEDAIKDSVNQAPPSQGISLPKWTWPVGSCKPFPITFSISNLSAKANDGGAFCDNYNNTYHPLIYWFLYMLLALYLFVLWNRTMVQVLGSR